MRRQLNAVTKGVAEKTLSTEGQSQDSGIRRVGVQDREIKPKAERVMTREELIADHTPDIAGPMGRYTTPSAMRTLQEQRQRYLKNRLGTQSLHDTDIRTTEYAIGTIVAFGTLNAFGGGPNSGKTSSIASIAAAFSGYQGNHKDNGCFRANTLGYVFIFTTEDDTRGNLAVKLYASGCSAKYVRTKRGCQIDSTGPFVEPLSPEWIACLVADVKYHAGDEPVILVFDPIDMLVKGGRMNYTNSRAAYERLLNLAIEHNWAVIGISHTVGVAGNRDPVSRFTDKAFREVARTACVFAEIRAGALPSGATHVIVPVKVLGSERLSFGYRFEPVVAEHRKGNFNSDVIQVMQRFDESPREVLALADAPPPKIGSGEKSTERKIAMAEDMIRDTLNGKLMYSYELEALILSNGISFGSYKKARENVKTYPTRHNGRTVLTLHEADLTEEALAALPLPKSKGE